MVLDLFITLNYRIIIVIPVVYVIIEVLNWRKQTKISALCQITYLE
jgi:hypothetical protein